MAEKKADQGQEKKPESKLPIQKIMTAIFVVVNLSVSGFGTYLVYASTLGWKAPTITEESMKIDPSYTFNESSANPYVYTMDKFTVNLEGEPKRTVRLEVNLHMLGKDAFEEVMLSENRARVRDRIVRLLNEKNFSELESIQGKLFLKDKIAMEVNSILNKGVVKDVYFTDFVVQ
jgi:flagellar FliL protein